MGNDYIGSVQSDGKHLETNSANSYTTSLMELLTLNYTLKVLKMAYLKLYIFYHSKKTENHRTIDNEKNKHKIRQVDRKTQIYTS